MNKQRIIFYIDGFNLYYGLKSKNWKSFYWLDIVGFCEKFVKKHQTLVEVNYFTAIPKDKGKHDRLDLFLSANKQNPLLNVFMANISINQKNVFGATI